MYDTIIDMKRARDEGSRKFLSMINRPVVFFALACQHCNRLVVCSIESSVNTYGHEGGKECESVYNQEKQIERVNNFFTRRLIFASSRQTKTCSREVEEV